MTILSKILQEELDKSHYVTDKRFLFLGSSALSLMTWTVSLVYLHQSSKRVLVNNDEVFTAYTNQQKKKSRNKDSFGQTFVQLKQILGQVLSSKDYAYASGIAVALILRTMCDLWMIKNGTQIEAAIIASDTKKLKSNIVEFIYSMPILALVNNGLKYCLNHLQLSLRHKISAYLNDKYTSGLTYYHVNVLDTKFKNIDQLLTNDVDKFCTTLVNVYTNVTKPLLDIVIFVQRLSVTYTGMATPAAMVGYLVLAGTILTNARRPMTRLTVRESQLEGELRFVHSRLITNCEEIAFYQGNNREKLTLAKSLDRLRDHLSKMLLFRFNLDYLDNIIARYIATVCGYLALSIPFLSNRYQTDNHNQRLETYYTSGRIMVKLAESIGRLVHAGRDLNELSAYTQRVNELIVHINDEQALRRSLPAVEIPGSGHKLIAFSGELTYCETTNPMINFMDVPLCTPSGDILVQSLNFKIHLGQNVIITGPNGSGKSSVFRLLGELWPLYGGKLIKPRNDKLFYIPQKPYMALGSFRDQLIYPDTVADMKRKSKTDKHLIDILNIVQLDYLLERETFDSIQNWHEVLSGGEKQRVALARLFYQRPQFAILDECTSAVSIDVEQSIYQTLCEQKFCSLLSVTHRVRQLHKYHDYVLKFDGQQGCSFKILIEDDL